MTADSSIQPLTPSTPSTIVQSLPTDNINILQRENEYLQKHIQIELNQWRKNNYNSIKHSIISIVICAISLVFGVFLLASHSFQNQIRNIISTSFIGAGGTISLLGSLLSLRDLFKKIDENKQDVKDFTDLFKRFQSKSEDEGNIQGIATNNQDRLCKHMEDQTKILNFLKKLNRHMQYMSICRSLYVSIASLIFVTLSIISVFLIMEPNQTPLFESIDSLLISFSAICLLSNISDMISIQLIIPKISEKISKNEKRYKYKIDLTKIIKKLIKSNEENEQPRQCLPCSNIIKYLELLTFVILVPFYFFHGLMSLNLEVKRISMGNDELDGVNRVLYGLPLEKENYEKSSESIPTDMQVLTI
ncbi:27035_t:CDS:1 [Gigaspora margarita]|uniref:27035_t:CDS:1 n=1 Tax=Gigaspora margarita TaxID=4874 RepID=A0ABN7W5W4_GIGMA|nr:27035_t:CDS:1 [Gigaspora margarita]